MLIIPYLHKFIKFHIFSRHLLVQQMLSIEKFGVNIYSFGRIYLHLDVAGVHRNIVYSCTGQFRGINLK